MKVEGGMETEEMEGLRVCRDGEELIGRGVELMTYAFIRDIDYEKGL